MPSPSRPIHMDEVREQVALGVVDGLKLIMEDKSLMKQFWDAGYDELATRSAAGATMWFGRRMMLWLVAAIVGAGLVFLLRTPR